MISRRDIVTLSCWLGFCTPCYCEKLLIKKPYPSLSMQGNIYSSTCVFEERKLLRKSLRELKCPDEEKAWKIVEMILCAPSNKQLVHTLKTISRMS